MREINERDNRQADSGGGKGSCLILILLLCFVSTFAVGKMLSVLSS